MLVERQYLPARLAPTPSPGCQPLSLHQTPHRSRQLSLWLGYVSRGGSRRGSRQKSGTSSARPTCSSESVSIARDRGSCSPHHSRYENQARWTTCNYEARKHAQCRDRGSEEQSRFAPRRQGARTWQRELLHVRATPTDRHGGICAGVASESRRKVVRRPRGHDSLACGGQCRGGTFGGRLCVLTMRSGGSAFAAHSRSHLVFGCATRALAVDHVASRALVQPSVL